MNRTPIPFNTVQFGCTWAALILATLFGSPSHALTVMNVDPSAQYVAPTSNSVPYGYADFDPGWDNVSTFGVYLGNGWILTARHAGLFAAGQTTESLNGEVYNVIDRWIMRNPTSFINSSTSLSSLSDIGLVRLDTTERFSGTPEENTMSEGMQIQASHLVSTSFASNTDLLVIGNGRTRVDNDSLLHHDPSSLPFSGGLLTPCDNCLDSHSGLHALGYNTQGPVRKTWGTNKLESTGTTASRISNFDRINGTNYYYLDGSGLNDTAMLAFDFDEYDFVYDNENNPIDGGTEIQAAAGDSGHAVYAWNSSQSRWEIAGVMHTIANYSNAARAVALRNNGGGPFGDFTFFSNLLPYVDQIEAYMAPPTGYETSAAGIVDPFFSLVDREFGYDSNDDVIVLNEGLWGDINLDGVVSGDGTGSWETDDLTAMREGWGWDINDEPGAQIEGVFAWKRGDMNQDGTTDWEDFILLRNGFNQATGSQISLAAVLGSGTTVPEPSTALLIGLLVSSGLACRIWRR